MRKAITGGIISADYGDHEFDIIDSNNISVSLNSVHDSCNYYFINEYVNLIVCPTTTCDLPLPHHSSLQISYPFKVFLLSSC